MKRIGIALMAVIASAVLLAPSACGQDELEFQLYQEGFEIGLAQGGIADVEEAGWDIGNSTPENSGVMNPETGVFLETSPLAAPADGSHLLFIDDLGESGGPFDNTFVAVNTGVVIQEDATYRITAATGHAIDATIGDQSIQAWIQPPPLDGEIDRRGFVAQSFTTSNWIEADEGEWLDNSIEFTAFPDLLAFNPATGESDMLVVGSELVILVTNFNTDCCGIPGGQPGIVYWDNFRVTSDVAPKADGLQAGDADQDWDFDQFDLVQVQVAAKYLTGQQATWGEGDWNGAPGGIPGDPPLGDGVFDQRDIIAALAPGHYLTGPYTVVGPSGGNVGLVHVSVPEPSTMLLAVLAVIGMFRLKGCAAGRGYRA